MIAPPHADCPRHRPFRHPCRAAVMALMETVAALTEITRRQEHLIAELNHALHGKRSEKLTEDERQLAFEDLSIALAEVEADKDTRAAKAGDGTSKSTPKRTIGNLPAALPRIEEVIEPANLICPCGCGIMHKIGEGRSERLDIVPAQLRVIVTVRPKYACRTCTDGVTQAPARPHLIMGGLQTFLTDSRVEMDTNPVENTIRPIAKGGSLCGPCSSICKHWRCVCIDVATRARFSGYCRSNRIGSEIFGADLIWGAGDDLNCGQYAGFDKVPDPVVCYA